MYINESANKYTKELNEKVAEKSLSEEEIKEFEENAVVHDEKEEEADSEGVTQMTLDTE